MAYRVHDRKYIVARHFIRCSVVVLSKCSKIDPLRINFAEEDLSHD
jgi:hypothetical protein